MNFSIFPKTTAGPSASEKPCGRMLSIFLFFRKRLPDQVLRKSFVGVLGSSWHLLGSLEALLEPPGALLGASWSLLGRSWGGLRASWDPLGPSWRRSKTRQKQRAFLNPQKIPQKILHPKFFGPILSAKIDQNRTQNESKFKTIFKSEKNALQEPLGAVLGRSWGILGGILRLQKSLRYRQA